MIKRSEYTRVQQQAAAMIRAAGIQLTEAEAQRIDVVDFGLGRVAAEGVQVFTFFATERISAKVLVMLPHQTEPEHWHPPRQCHQGWCRPDRSLHSARHRGPRPLG